jgi:lipoprotein-anchoring transpeptidase ErfK/SrfK
VSARSAPAKAAQRGRALACATALWLPLAAVLSQSPSAAQPRPWVAQGDLPIAAWVKSVEVTRSDEPLYQAPSSAEKRRGAVARGARLRIYAVQRGPGCAGRFLLVGPLAWLCEDGAQFSEAAPEEDLGEPQAPDGLPYRYHFVGPNGSFGYRALSTAEDGVPDAEFLKGFGVALIRVEKNPRGEPFGLTTAGLWLPMRDLNAVQTLNFHGRDLDGTLALGWVMGEQVFATRAPGEAADRALRFAKFQELSVLEERTRSGRRWLRVGEHAWLSDRDLRTPTPAPMPSQLRPGERWIDIDTKSQVLTAYIGERPVFATLVSTGRGAKGSELDTPRGTRRLWVKLRTSTMDNLDDESALENYAIQAVPWVMYFERGYGLHGTFWHRDFGHKHSHGCVNLAPLDAQHLFYWTSPRLPAGWTAALPTIYELGTLISVR